MEKNRIRANAIRLWELLGFPLNRRWSYTELKKRLGLDDFELTLAIGWLARENNIEIETDAGTGEKIFFLYSVSFFG